MRRIPGFAASLLLAMAIIAPVATIGCSAHASGTVKGANATMPADPGTSHAGNGGQQHAGSALAGN
jgi:hypothetical protein